MSNEMHLLENRPHLLKAAKQALGATNFVLKNGKVCVEQGSDIVELPEETQQQIMARAAQIKDEPVYNPLSRMQFSAMLTILGFTHAQIEAAMDAAIADTTERAIAKSKLWNSTVYRRDNTLFAQLAPILNITDEELNMHWKQAEAIR